MTDEGAGPLDEGVFADLLESTGGDPDFLAELIDIYLDDAPRQVVAMREAALGGRIDDLVRAAHTLKGSSSSIGAAELSERSRTLELAGRAGALEDAVGAVDGIEAELSRVREALLARRPG